MPPLPDSGLERALDSWSLWSPAPATRPGNPRRLAGGLTNVSWRVVTCHGDAVIRIHCADDRRLGIDRTREALIVDAVVDAGVAPAVWFRDPGNRFTVSRYIPGRVWSDADLRDPEQCRRLAAVVNRYRALSLPLPARDYVAYLDHYVRQLLDWGIAVTPALADRLEHWRERIARWQYAGWQPRLTHHDLTPGNIIEGEQGLMLIDWEYAAPGCPALDDLALGRASGDPVVAALAGLMNDYWALVRSQLGADAAHV